jgi:CspA family cold shock protein
MKITDRGYGFIKPDGAGADLFFHASAFQHEEEPLAGDRVAYEIANDSRNGKQQAVNVRLA